MDEYRISVKPREDDSLEERYLVAGNTGCYEISGLQVGQSYVAEVTVRRFQRDTKPTIVYHLLDLIIFLH